MKTKKTTNLFKINKNISLNVNQHSVDVEFIPKEIDFIDNNNIVEKCAILLQKNIPILLIGETGTGKTSVVRHIAHNTKNGFVRVNHNGGTTIEDIVGRWTINDKGQTEWIDGVLIQAMKKGYWYLADEINACGAEINFVYHSLLDDDGRIVLAEKSNEVVIPHENFRFFGAMNPPTDYAGTKELNRALLSRFAVLKVEYPAPAIETKILVERTGIEKDIAEKMVNFAVQIRSGQANGTYQSVLSTRDLIMWASLFTTYGKYMISAEASILNKVPEDDFNAIKDMLSMNFKALDENKPVEPEPAPEIVDDVFAPF